MPRPERGQRERRRTGRLGAVQSSYFGGTQMRTRRRAGVSAYKLGRLCKKNTEAVSSIFECAVWTCFHNSHENSARSVRTSQSRCIGAICRTVCNLEWCEDIPHTENARNDCQKECGPIREDLQRCEDSQIQSTFSWRGSMRMGQ